MRSTWVTSSTSRIPRPLPSPSRRKVGSRHRPGPPGSSASTAGPASPTGRARLEPLPVRHPACQDALPCAVRAPAREHPVHGGAQRLVVPRQSPAELLLVQELEEHTEVCLVAGSKPDRDGRVVHHECYAPLLEP